MNKTPAVHIPPVHIMRIQAVMARTGMARSTIYRLIKEGRFPASKKLTAHSAGWPSDQIDQWVSDRLAGVKA